MKTVSQTIQSSSTQQPSDWKTRGRTIIVGLGLTIGAIILGTILSLGPLLLGGMSSLAFLAILTVSEVGYVLTAWIYLRQWFDERVTITMPTKGQFGWILGGAIVMLAIGAVITIISTRTGITTGRVDQELLTGNRSTVLILAVLAFIVIAPAEEYFFRGVIQRRMMRSFSTPVAILIGALIFVLPHAIGYLGNIEGILLLSMAPFSLAIITGILYEKFDNLSIPILCHGIYNATLFMATYFTAF